MNKLKTKAIIHHRGTEGTEVFLTALAAQQTIKSFSLCPLRLCGEKVF